MAADLLIHSIQWKVKRSILKLFSFSVALQLVPFMAETSCALQYSMTPRVEGINRLQHYLFTGNILWSASTRASIFQRVLRYKLGSSHIVKDYTYLWLTCSVFMTVVTWLLETTTTHTHSPRFNRLLPLLTGCTGWSLELEHTRCNKRHKNFTSSLPLLRNTISTSSTFIGHREVHTQDLLTIL